MSHEIPLNHALEISLHACSSKEKDINNIELIDALCRIEQAQGLLSVWMEANISDTMTLTMMGALMTLLEGVPESMKQAESELFNYEHADYIDRKHRLNN